MTGDALGIAFVLGLVAVALVALWWMRADLLPPAPRFACSACKATFPTFDMLTLHEDEQHGGAR